MKPKLESFQIRGLCVLAVSSLGLLLYSNTLHCWFHFDDFEFIVSNSHIRHLSDLKGIFNRWPCRFITFYSLAFNYHFNHLNVAGYHIFNVAIHLLSAILVSWLAYLTFATPVMKDQEISRHATSIALFTGLIFVSHPIQTQAVTFIWQRAACLAALFCLASLCFYIKSRLLQNVSSGRGAGRWYYFLSLSAALMAMFTKENAIILPLLILLYEVSFLNVHGALNWRRLFPFLIISFTIPAMWVFFTAERIQAQQSFVANISSLQYFSTELRVMLTYIRLAFLPLHQNLDYDYPLSRGLWEAPTLVSIIIIAILLFSAGRAFSRYRVVSFSVFWFFLALLPESSFFPFADVIFEHRLYLPLAGYCLFLVGGAYYLWGKDHFKIVGTVLMILVCCYAVMTYQRNQVWKNELTLWDDTVKKSPYKARPYDIRGIYWAQHGNFCQAISDYTKAIEILPAFTEVYYNRGVAYAKLGKLSQAISDFKKSTELKPDFKEAYYNLALIDFQLKEYTMAWLNMRKAHQLGCAVSADIIDRFKKASGS